MKLRERWLPLLGTVFLVVVCTALPFLWFAARDRQLDTTVWTNPADSDFLSAAGQENAVARELYYWRQQPSTYSSAHSEPTSAALALETVQPCLDGLHTAKVLPQAYLDAMDTLMQDPNLQCSTYSEASGMTTYDFQADEMGNYLRLTVSKYGTLTGLSGKLGLADGFDSADVASAYRTMLGLDCFTDWEAAEPLGYGSPSPCYSTEAQLYLIANMDRGYFSMSVTSMSPEAYAGL